MLWSLHRRQRQLQGELQQQRKLEGQRLQQRQHKRRRQ